eukprot:TRINITY_DN962_c0_g1_i1.p1 TRINITY_DN962_c0_g1~~TRINITY_DN962_c0_g1_i1.p1  ORF type:complete len:448 (+),score=112.85 TRINITY_DN962_c0_g1_i1:173-1516(+)
MRAARSSVDAFSDANGSRCCTPRHTRTSSQQSDAGSGSEYGDTGLTSPTQPRSPVEYSVGYGSARRSSLPRQGKRPVGTRGPAAPPYTDAPGDFPNEGEVALNFASWSESPAALQQRARRCRLLPSRPMHRLWCIAALPAAIWMGLSLVARIEREDVLFALGGWAWTHQSAGIALREAARGTPITGTLPPSIGGIYVSHYAPAAHRQAIQREALARMGLPPADWRSSWTRESVLEHKDAIAKLLWPGAADLRVGGQALEWVGTKTPAWVELAQKSVVTRRVKVGSAFLGRVANLRQHFDIYEEIVRKGHPAALVLEDDTIFVRHFPTLFQRVMAQAPPDFDIIFVGICMAKHAYDGRPARRHSELLWEVREHRCANGYVLSLKAAQRLLSSDWQRTPEFRNIDALLEARMGDTIPKSFWAEPALMYEGTKAYFSGMNSLRQKKQRRG